jgi:hypothetical protein
MPLFSPAFIYRWRRPAAEKRLTKTGAKTFSLLFHYPQKYEQFSGTAENIF